ncbi:MAG: hypothetical protein B6245_04085 [Desulfobacteraceae bacterium 4572_88]|nr:MAG: hypothetical protein B6245_04085 [Desulfobacteraceae bacterium 4572_88]
MRNENTPKGLHITAQGQRSATLGIGKIGNFEYPEGVTYNSPGSAQRHSGNRKSEIGNRKSEIGNRESGIGN